jgi:MSHA biogenesis protein MshP
MSAAPGRPQVSSHRSAQHEGTPVNTIRSLVRGFASIAAIFLLVVLAALGAFMVSISSSQQLSAAQDVQGSRAYWAARAGLEWALGSLAATPAACPSPPAPFTVDGFTLALSCTRSAFDEAGAPRVIYALTSKASVGAAPGGIGYIERSVSASVEK